MLTYLLLVYHSFETIEVGHLTLTSASFKAFGPTGVAPLSENIGFIPFLAKFFLPGVAANIHLEICQGDTLEINLLSVYSSESSRSINESLQ